MRAWKKLEQQSIVIKTLWAVIAILVLLYLFQSLSIASLPKTFRVYFPPNLDSGGVVAVDQVPKAQVYAFAALIFSQINTWPNSGGDDYGYRIKQYRFYISNRFANELEQDLKYRQENAQLDRVRLMSGVVGDGYAIDKVKTLGNGRWQVSLDLNLRELVSGVVFKDARMHYALQVSRAKLPTNVNPWGLVIDGFVESPYRVKTKE